MKNILVTGGAGYIGSHITETLLKQDFKVFIVDDLSAGFKKLINKKAKFFKININNCYQINKILRRYNIDSIIHLAAKTNITEAEKKPKMYYKSNVQGTLNLIKACKNTNVKNFLFSSTCAVYTDKVKHVKETSKTKPKGIYGLTKLKGENLIKKHLKDNKKNYAILRYFNVAGSSPSKKIGQINKADQLFKNLSLAVKKKNPIFNIYGSNYNTFDGTCVRDFIHVSDLADIHIKVLIKINNLNKSIVMNCGYGKGISVLEIINEFKKFTKSKVKINYKEKRRGDRVEIVANVNKLGKFIKWKPKFRNLSKMVKSSIEWEKNIN